MATSIFIDEFEALKPTRMPTLPQATIVFRYRDTSTGTIYNFPMAEENAKQWMSIAQQEISGLQVVTKDQMPKDPPQQS